MRIGSSDERQHRADAPGRLLVPADPTMPPPSGVQPFDAVLLLDVLAG